MYMILSNKNDIVRVLDTEDFVIDTFSVSDFKLIQKQVGMNNFFDATRYVKKVVGNIVLLWVVNTYGDEYEMCYYVGKEGVGLLYSDYLIIPKIYSLDIMGGKVVLKYRGDYAFDLPSDVKV